MHFLPVYLVINLLVHLPHHRHTITPYDVQSQRHLLGRHIVVSGSDDALDGLLQDEVHGLVAGQERPDHGAPVEGEDRDFLLVGLAWFVHKVLGIARNFVFGLAVMRRASYCSDTR